MIDLQDEVDRLKADVSMEQTERAIASLSPRVMVVRA